MTKEIKLTQGKVVLVDDDDFEYLNQFKWRFFVKGYARRNSPFLLGKRTVILMHREIMQTPADKQTDHINLDGLDNRRANLRICTPSENKQNMEAQSNNKSGFKGVDWVERDGKWRASIRVNGKRIYLGHFDDPVVAACAYDAAAVKYFGEFARGNFSNKDRTPST